MYNLVERKGYETDYAPIAAEHGLTVFPYYALASGFLTGKYRSEADFGKSPRGQGAANYLNEQGLKVLNAIDEVAEKHNTVPKEQLKQILSSTSLNLDRADLELLDTASR